LINFRARQLAIGDDDGLTPLGAHQLLYDVGRIGDEAQLRQHIFLRNITGTGIHAQQGAARRLAVVGAGGVPGRAVLDHDAAAYAREGFAIRVPLVDHLGRRTMPLLVAVGHDAGAAILL